MLQNPVATTHRGPAANPRTANPLVRGFALCLCLAALALPEFGAAQTIFQGTIQANLSADPSVAPPPVAISGTGTPTASCSNCVNIAPPWAITAPGAGYDLSINAPSATFDLTSYYTLLDGLVHNGYEYLGGAADWLTLSTTQATAESASGGTLITGAPVYLDIYALPGSPGAIYVFTMVSAAGGPAATATSSTLDHASLNGYVYMTFSGSTNGPTGTEAEFSAMTLNPCSVTVSTARFAAPTTIAPVPDLIGQLQSTAITMLQAAGFNINGPSGPFAAGPPTITTESSSTVPAGYVISQSPCANSLAAGGSSIALVVSSGPAVAPTPITFTGDGSSTWNYFLYSHGYYVNTQTGQLTNSDEAFIDVFDNLPPLTLTGNPATFQCTAAGGVCSPCQTNPCAGATSNGTPVIFEIIYNDSTNPITCGSITCGCGLFGCVQQLNGSGTLTIRDLSTCTPVLGAYLGNCNFQQGTVGTAFLWAGGPASTGQLSDFPNHLVTQATLVLTYTQTEFYTGSTGLVTTVANAPIQYLNITGNVQGIDPLVSPPPATPDPYASLCYPDSIGFCGANGATSPLSGTIFGLGGPLFNNFNIDWTATLSPTPYSPAAPPVTVPNVVGMTQANASTAITAAGLVVGTVSSASSSSVPAGQVISQSPGAGSSAASGSTVNITVSSGPVMVTVPATVGKTQAAASTAITAATLVVGAVTTQSSMTVIPGVVLAESPTAGSSAPSGSAVNLTVSSGSTCADVALIHAAFGSKRGQPNYNAAADVNNDGVVNVVDLAMVTHALPNGTVCD
jgi:beta-lactam-binding protein with PASTA domain